MVCVMHSMATLVFPAPVGAHTSMFSLVLYAVSHTTDWILNKATKCEDGNYQNGLNSQH